MSCSEFGKKVQHNYQTQQLVQTLQVYMPCRNVIKETLNGCLLSLSQRDGKFCQSTLWQLLHNEFRSKEYNCMEISDTGTGDGFVLIMS